MKSFSKIVMSDSEPQKDCLWIKDNAFYMFGSNGWQKINDYSGIIDNIDKNIKELEPRIIDLPILFDDVLNNLAYGEDLIVKPDEPIDYEPLDCYYIRDLGGITMSVPRYNYWSGNRYEGKCANNAGDIILIYVTITDGVTFYNPK